MKGPATPLFGEGLVTRALLMKSDGDVVWLRGILEARYANRANSDAMLNHLRGQFYTSRLPAELRYASGVRVAHKTGDFPPISGSDVGIIEYNGGPIVISVFTNGNSGEFPVLENTIGQIAAKLVNAWR